MNSTLGSVVPLAMFFLTTSLMWYVSYSLLLRVYFLVLLTIAEVVCKRVVSVSVGGAD